MASVQCSVENCSYHKDNSCYAPRVDIAGKGAQKDETTCCCTFLNKITYSNIVENEGLVGVCECIICKVTNCKHNENQLCALDSIQVDSMGEVNYYTETNCTSFCKQ